MRYIQKVSRGYCFVGEVREVKAEVEVEISPETSRFEYQDLKKQMSVEKVSEVDKRTPIAEFVSTHAIDPSCAAVYDRFVSRTEILEELRNTCVLQSRLFVLA
jgi:hypothetical protein